MKQIQPITLFKALSFLISVHNKMDRSSSNSSSNNSNTSNNSNISSCESSSNSSSSSSSSSSSNSSSSSIIASDNTGTVDTSNISRRADTRTRKPPEKFADSEYCEGNSSKKHSSLYHKENFEIIDLTGVENKKEVIDLVSESEEEVIDLTSETFHSPLPSKSLSFKRLRRNNSSKSRIVISSSDSDEDEYSGCHNSYLYFKHVTQLLILTTLFLNLL